MVDTSDFLTESLRKVADFDFNWSSLISNNPLLFNDLEYLKIRTFVDEVITNEEIEAYKTGELTHLYHTLDALLICNLQYYDRIINYCTMCFLGYVNIGNGTEMQKIKTNNLLQLSLTPTQIYCAVFTNVNSTIWEIQYAWFTEKMKRKFTSLEKDFDYITKNNTIFHNFNGTNAIRLGIQGFRNQWSVENTSNDKLSVVCEKFTNASTAISTSDLSYIFDYYKHTQEVNLQLEKSLNKSLDIMFNGDSSRYGAYVFTNEFFLLTVKFGVSVTKTENGTIKKDYFSNGYECLVAEQGLSHTIKEQISWSRQKPLKKFNNDKKLLVELLYNMLEGQGYKNTICLKETNTAGVSSKITFSGCFDKVRITEKFYMDNKVRLEGSTPDKTLTRVLSKRNASKYIVDRGYCLFGSESEIHDLTIIPVTRQTLLEHYSKYVINVRNYLVDVVNANKKNRNDIIDIVLGYDPIFYNHTILVTNYKQTNHKKILASGLADQNRRLNNNEIYGSSIWKVLTD